MAPKNKAKAEKEQRLASILEFATRLQKRLESKILDRALAKELSEQLARPFPLPLTSNSQDLDELGRGLWNVSIRSQQLAIEFPGVSAQLRVFAFYLLDIAYQAFSKQGQGTNENLIRVLRVALKAGRVCVNDRQLDLAGRVFERAAIYVETRNKEHGPKVNLGDEDELVITQLTAEYFLLRAALSWKSDRLDLVDYWLSKMFIRSGEEGSVDLIEKKADFLYEIGKAALKKRDCAVAAEWLGKSFDTIEVIDQSESTSDCNELRLAVMTDFVRALIGMKDSDSVSRASGLASRMEDDSPEFRMSTCLLRLGCLFANTPVDVEQCFNVILLIIRTAHMLDNNIMTIIAQIHLLKKANENNKTPDSHSVSYACQALESLLPRLYELGNQPWIEKVVVTRVWLGVSEQPTLASAKRLEELFQETYETIRKPFSPEATHAAQSLLWKLIDNPLGLQQDGGSETWCRLACNALFQNAGDLNKSRLGRKLILIALSSGDENTAREAYFALPESGKNAPVTKYLIYKLALQSGDDELASDSLDGVLKASSSDASFLHACTLEAQQNGNRRQAIAALQKVLQYYSNSTPVGIYMPALLRATAKLILKEMEADVIPRLTALSEVCKIFEGAMIHSNTFRTLESGEPNDRYQAELRWFASYSYNLTLTHMADIEPGLIVRFMTVCIAFVDMLRSQDREDSELMYRLLLCRFLAASALVVLGRSEDNVQRSLSYYLDVRRQIEAYQSCHMEAIDKGNFPADTKVNMAVKDFELLKYDLEAVLKLQHWNDLDRVLARCLAKQHSSRWGTIADLIIHIHTHIISQNLDSHYQTKIPLVIEKIINASWKENNRDVNNFSRWMRCLYQMTLNIDPTMALQCVENARTIAIGAQAGRASNPYPKEELAWLATSAFNHALDTFCAGDSENGTLWAETALNLAMTADKDTALHDQLQKMWMTLQAKATKL